MKVLHLDSNHSLLLKALEKLNIDNHCDFTSSKNTIENIIGGFHGIVIRSRFTIDRQFIDKAINLKFIARVGAGLENIDTDYAKSKGIHLISAPEGNRNAVGEHTLGLLLNLTNKITRANNEVKEGIWQREINRGFELEGKTIGIIGYGNMGKAFAKKLIGFDCDVICYDIEPEVGDELAEQVSLKEFKKRVDVISLHTPQNESSIQLINASFIDSVSNSFWLINTARGSSVITKDVLNAINSGKILGAGLDVLEYEKTSFESLFSSSNPEENFSNLIASEKVILTPHVAGWTYESHEKLAQVIVDKIKILFFN